MPNDIQRKNHVKSNKQYDTKASQNPKVTFDEETIRAIFGHEAAEDENIDRLKRYYVKTEIYNCMRSSIPLYLLVGHKGVGKSALFKILSYEDKEIDRIPIIIQPDDILGIELDNNSFLQKIRLWKEGLAKIIFKELLFSVNDYLVNPIQNENMKKWIHGITTLVNSIFGKKLSELQDSYLDLSSSQLITFFKNSFFQDKIITVYLDDLDRGWKNSKNDVENLSAMLNAIRDLSRESINLKFRVGLRSDVYYAVRTSDETTDKIDGSVIWLKWTNYEILLMLIKRIRSYFEQDLDEEKLLCLKSFQINYYLHPVFEERFKGKGHWENAPMYKVLMSLIRKRPRDLVKLCTLAARQAYCNNHNKIMTKDLENVFSNYSNDRLTDTGNEYQSELPKIKELLLKMKPSKKEIEDGKPCNFTRGDLLKKIENILSMSNFTFKDGKAVTPSSLAAFLYKINFVTAKKDLTTGIQRIYYDENQYIYNDFTDFGYTYEIHPAYRWALQPESMNDLYSQIELSD